MFSGCTVPVLSDRKEAKLGCSDQDASPSEGRNTGAVLVSHWAWKCAPTAISSAVDISKVPRCHLLRKITSRFGVS